MQTTNSQPRTALPTFSPLGWYLHVPFCRHACPYCDFYKIELRDRPARDRIEFPALLAREHELLLEAHGDLAARPLASIYFGGGTPSTLSPPGVAGLLSALRSRHPSGEPEITLEANPENLTAKRCEAWRSAGITRLSIGVQSFALRDLERLERLHAPETIATAMRNARLAGFRNISLDLMFALPGQTPREWLANLQRALELEPEHLSFYGLTLHEGTPFFEEHRAGRLAPATDDAYAAMYLEGADLLSAAGFEHYEISNFARPGFRSVHNQRYWKAEDVTGLGPGAHSSLGTRRWFNPEDLGEWQAGVNAGRLPHSPAEQLAEDVLREEELFRRLRRCEGFTHGASEADARFFAWLETSSGAAAAKAGWIARDGGRAWLTPEGWLRSDALLLQMVKSPA
ncbi:MAG: hypothetical protein PWP23_2107 [Candidatus Sumerlaeota bacterium]|nr:hypothetical protein [Candidatus Sumerlaeota bacterium]